MAKNGKPAFAPVGTKGEYAWVAKELVHIDPDYQRKNVSEKRVSKIVNRLNWAAFGAILVVRRLDGSLWAYDGQHRKIAASRRDDIKEVPCLIFNEATLEGEAAAFVEVNTVRGPMTAFDAFRAQLVAKDQVALTVKQLVEQTGYQIGYTGKFKIACVGEMLHWYRKNQALFLRTLQLATSIANGEPVSSDLFGALAYAEEYLSKSSDTLTKPINSDKLHKSGLQEIGKEMKSAAGYYGSANRKNRAEGVIKLLNNGRRDGNRIPSLMTPKPNGVAPTVEDE